MSDGVGIRAAVQRIAQQGVPAAQQVAAQQVSIAAPGLARVPLPPRDPSEQPNRPRKAANPLSQPRDLSGGTSPLATASVADAFAGADAFTGDPQTSQGDVNAAPDERGQRQASVGTKQLPSQADLIAFTRTRRGELVYLEASRWYGHIVPSHVTNPPMSRGKRTTTWWPVVHSSSGRSSMSEQQVIGVIMDAVRDGHWQNAMKGTLLSVYDLPEEQANQFGVSEVKVSVAPDGRVLSAYPSAGTNVLAVRELTAEEQAQIAGYQAHAERGFQTAVPQTTFG